MAAKYYVYRNLNKGEGTFFSVKHKGLVVDHFEHGYIFDATLKVNPGGRNATIKKGQKQVHAYVIGNEYNSHSPGLMEQGQQITYNPFVDETFVWKDNGEPVTHVDILTFDEGKIYGIVFDTN